MLHLHVERLCKAKEGEEEEEEEEEEYNMARAITSGMYVCMYVCMNV